MWNQGVYIDCLRSILDYLVRIGDATSQLINVAFLFGQSANESISGRAWRQRNTHRSWGIIRRLIDWLAFPLETDHCKKSHDADVSRAGQLMRDQRL